MKDIRLSSQVATGSLTRKLRTSVDLEPLRSMNPRSSTGKLKDQERISKPSRYWGAGVSKPIALLDYLGIQKSPIH